MIKLATLFVLLLLWVLPMQAVAGDVKVVAEGTNTVGVEVPETISHFKPTPYRWTPYQGNPLDYQKKYKAKVEAAYIAKMKAKYKAKAEAAYIAKVKAAYQLKAADKAKTEAAFDEEMEDIYHPGRRSSDKAKLGLARKVQVAHVQINSPYGISVDDVGNIYIVDYSEHRVRKVSVVDGSVTTIAGTGKAGFSGDDGPATKAQLNHPFGVSVDSAGNVYIADYGNHRIRKVSAIEGTIITVAGTGEAGYSGDSEAAISAQLNYPIGVSVDSFDNIYIADYWNHRIRKVSALDDTIETVAGTGVPGYAGDYGPAASAQLNYPTGVAVDSFDEVYIADYANHRIRRIAGDGMIKTVAGMGVAGYSGDGGGGAFAKLNYPFGVSFDASDNLYIADFANHHVRKISAIDDVISTVMGTGERGFSGDGGSAVTAKLNFPIAVGVDGDGDLYVADHWNNRIRKLSSVDGTVRTIAGTGVSRYFTRTSSEPSFSPLAESIGNHKGVFQAKGKYARNEFRGSVPVVFPSIVDNKTVAVHTSTTHVTLFKVRWQ